MSGIHTGTRFLIRGPCWRRRPVWMGRALSRDLRDRVVAAVESGVSCRRAAERFGVSAASAIRWRRWLSLTARQRPSGRAVIAGRPRLRRMRPSSWTRSSGSPTPRWRSCARCWPARARGQHRHAVAVLPPPRDHAQKKTAHAAEQDRPDVLKRREAWFDGQLDLDPERLVFIDETWAIDQHGAAPRPRADAASGCA